MVQLGNEDKRESMLKSEMRGKANWGKEKRGWIRKLTLVGLPQEKKTALEKSGVRRIYSINGKWYRKK